MQPFVVKIEKGPAEPLGEETRTQNQHIGCVTVVQGNHVVQITERGVEESRGPNVLRAVGSVVCLTFDTEDGRRFFRTYEHALGKVTVTTSEPVPIPSWEFDPALGIEPSRLRQG